MLFDLCENSRIRDSRFINAQQFIKEQLNFQLISS